MPSILSERAMLAKLKITMWSARKLDRKVTDKVNAEHGAHADAGRYNKALVSKNALAAIVTASSAARSYHRKSTLPWRDDGARILGSAGHLQFAEKMRELKTDFDLAVDSFVAGYDDFVIDAKARLNGLFDPADYPDASVIRGAFTFKTELDPCPDAADFRVQMADSQANEIRRDIEERNAAALRVAVRDVWERIAEHVGHMAERLKEYNPTGGTTTRNGAVVVCPSGSFRDSLVENVRELVALLPALNITGDAKLTEIADRMARELCADDPDTLRENAGARASVADAADRILADVSEYLA